MLNEKDKETLLAAALVLRIEAKWYYDVYRRESDGLNASNHDRGMKAYERYRELEKIARELDLIAFGNL